MLSPRWVRENIDIVKESLAKRKVNIDLDSFLLLDEERRKCIKETDKLKSIQNKKSKEIGRLKREGKDVKDLLSEMQEISSKLKALEKKRKEYEEKTREFLLNLPNRLHPDVPRDENQEVKRWGRIPEFDFPVKDHQQLGEELGILDFKAAVQVVDLWYAGDWEQDLKEL